ncbi:glycoside hydrolase family 3 C-terminal domain-containing protein [Ruminococcus sp. 5_1_39BFAA]|uniref:glycoside hydrolase family 3 protein n=1 Tax=Ruminococcus sp. 5_1_39BFAA TaxID=457412 RepID=UPI0035682E76
MNKWTRVLYQPNRPLKEDGYVTASKEHIALSKEAAGEGMVLLKNNDHLLPLKKGAKIALFGKGSFDYVKGGGGSGDVTVSYVHNLYDGLKMQGEHVDIYEPTADFYRENVSLQYKNGAVPGMTEEPELPQEIIEGAHAFTDTAIVVISRFSGEGWDRSSIEYNGEYNPWENEVSMPRVAGKIFPDGDFYLTAEEKKMIARVEEKFEKIAVVLNIGGMVDTCWIKNDDRISSVLVAWQGGMEGGLAAAEILCGKVNPSGKLADTFAAKVEDYPSAENFHESVHYVDYTDDIYVGYRYFETIPGAADKVVYPFGYGLSYTDFDVNIKKVWEENGQIKARVEVTNTGDVPGKEVIQLYYSAPQGILKKPARELAAFAKTRLLEAGESQMLTLSFAKTDMASYDDLGKITKSAYILEKGVYEFYIGTSIRDVEKADFALNVEKDTVTRQLSAKLVPSSLKKRMLSDGSFEELPQCEGNDPNACVLEKMIPGTEEALEPEVPMRGRKLCMNSYKEGVKPFIQVAEGKITLDEFMSQLSDEELLHLLGGQPNTGVANTYGFGNLPDYGVPNAMTADGPAGLRIAPECGVCTTAWPCATLLACTWNTELVELVGQAGAEEVKENNIAVWLTPAVNIHRNPLCGRNFEYYSEDPLISGKMGAAMVRGIQSQHIGATVKHFAANNKETNRKHSDSRVSERALREIYLKAFEIIVKEADPWAIMSSYNVINGHRASENRELLEDVLRGEWNFRGMVTSDWWTRGEHYKEIKAGNDVKMATGFPERVKKAMELGELDRADLERCARRVLELLLKID